MRHHIAILSMLALTGCAGVNPIEISTKPIENNITQPADVRAPSLRGITWKVVNKDNLQQFLDAQSKTQDNPNPVFVAISLQDYETLSLDMAELKRYIEQQKSIIVYYRNATAPKSTK